MGTKISIFYKCVNFKMTSTKRERYHWNPCQASVFHSIVWNVITTIVNVFDNHFNLFLLAGRNLKLF